MPEIKASSYKYQHLIQFMSPGSKGCCSECVKDDLWIKLLDPSQCAECHGEDEIGGYFCPICDYCCGC